LDLPVLQFNTRKLFQNGTIAELWDGAQLKVTFRRCFDHKQMLLWYEVLQIAQTLQINLTWKLESNGLYSVKSLYAVVKFRGILLVYIQNVWKIKVPPKIHFLWLLSHNRILTRDNLVKRPNVDDLTCVFCNEPKTSTQLFFECGC
jgi:hypothetical protein